MIDRVCQLVECMLWVTDSSDVLGPSRVWGPEDRATSTEHPCLSHLLSLREARESAQKCRRGKLAGYNHMSRTNTWRRTYARTHAP